jgi:hypothetical protein
MVWANRIAIALVVLVIVTGCMNTKPASGPPPRVNVNPCSVASKGVQVRINSDKLDSATVKPELQPIFVDNFKSPAATDMLTTYELNCYWGNKVGEKRDYYYCAGKYKAPELDETQTISRFLWKEFKVGFSVEQHDIGAWVDSSGKVHNEGTVFYLTTKTVDANCYVAN